MKLTVNKTYHGFLLKEIWDEMCIRDRLNGYIFIEIAA